MRLAIPLLILSFFGIGTNTYGQLDLQTESETHIFWQPNRKLTINDFEGGFPIDSCFIRDKESGRSVVPCLGIFLQVDIPKNYRKNKLEKVYFAPAFQRSCSYVLDPDTANFKDGQLLFDIYELATRIGRKYIWDIRTYMVISSDSTKMDVIRNNPDTILMTGVGNSFAGLARDSALKFANGMMAAYFNDLYFNVDSSSASYEDWRSLVDERLIDYERFATKPEDCFRMVKDKPILKKYRKAKW